METQWPLDRGGFLVSYWLETRREIHLSGLHFGWVFPKVSLLLCKYCWKGFWFSLSISQRVQCPLGSAQMVFNSFKAHFPTCLGINMIISITFPSKQPRFCLLRLKIADTKEKIWRPSAVLFPIMIYKTIPLIAKLKLCDSPFISVADLDPVLFAGSGNFTTKSGSGSSSGSF